MKILAIRLMGFGDVAAILVPAVRLIHKRHPGSSVDVLTYGAGNELMQLQPEVGAVLTVMPEQWPSDLDAAIASFMNIADVVASQRYDLVINLDTWFMPCFLARLLKDSGVAVAGNYLGLPIAAFFSRLTSHAFGQDYFQNPAAFLGSSFPNMTDWTTPWWQRHAPGGGYPEFYLGHCCGLGKELDFSLPAAPDEAFRRSAAGRKIIALSTFGSKPSKRYRQRDALTRLLEQAGFHVWEQFDGSLPLPVALGRLKVSDLLVTVPTSTQWLARAVGCPTLLIPGPLSPAILGAEIAVDRQIGCQYCCQTSCRENIDFGCLDAPPEHILDKIRQYLAAAGGTSA